MTTLLPSVTERQRALDQRFPLWQARTLDGMLAQVAAVYPERDYVVTDQRRYSYRDIDHWATALARGLIDAGLRPGEHVAVVMANYPAFAALKFAISRAGAVAVPINFLNRTEELGYVLKQSDSHFLVTMDGFRGMDYLAMLDELAPGWEQGGGGERLPALRRVFVFATGDGGRPGCARLEDLEAAGTRGLPVSFPEVDPQAVADIIYTSGTTGGPKGVMLTHDMLLRTAYGSTYARAFQDGRRVLFAMPMYHVYGYVEGLLAVLFVAGAVIPQLQFDPLGTLDGIARHRADDVLLVPIMTRAVLDALAEHPRDTTSLNAMLTSGGKSPPGIWQRIRAMLGDIEITTGYGMTEVTASSTVTRPDDPLDRLEHTNGRLRYVGAAGDPAIGGKLVAYRVVDPISGAEVAPGEMGELRVKGPGVTPGYYNKPEATAEAFDEEGWLRTGDLGAIDGDDYLRLLGRTKESYRCGGEQVLPLEVEDVLVTHPSVDQAFVVPVPDERMGEVGAAFVIPVAGAHIDERELIAHCAARLARFKVPKHVLSIRREELPTTATGRPRKFLLVEQARQRLAIP